MKKKFNFFHFFFIYSHYDLIAQNFEGQCMQSLLMITMYRMQCRTVTTLIIKGYKIQSWLGCKMVLIYFIKFQIFNEKRNG